MSNVAFLWIFSRGMELGVIVLCLLPLRLLLQRKIPRLYSYVLWAALPVNLIYNLVMRFIVMINRGVLDHVYQSPKIIVDERVVQAMRACWIGGSVAVVFGMLCYYILFLRRLVGSIRTQKDVYVTDRINAPFTLGLLRPKIYLPYSLEKEYYESVILHERVHIARKDVWMKYLAIGTLGLFWFQPILWFAYRLFINDMESACDEAVLRKKGVEFREEYARSLLEVTCETEKVRGVAIGYGNGEIKARIRNVMNYEPAGTKKRILAISLCILFTVVAIPISWQVPRVVQANREKTLETELSVSGTGLLKKEIITEKSAH